MTKMTLALALAAATLTTACATKSDLNDTHAQGWRRAQVLEIGKDQLTIQSPAQDCRAAPGANSGKALFAMTSYSHGGSPNWRGQRIVAVPSDITVNVGDWVFVNLDDCKLGLRKVGLRNEHP